LPNPVRGSSMLRLKSLFVAAILLLGHLSTAFVCEETPCLHIYYMAYSVNWNGQPIMISARLQLPLDVTQANFLR
jgi:hypothetical protein